MTETQLIENSTLSLLQTFGVNLLLAAVILIVGWWLSSVAARFLRKFLTRMPHMDRTVIPMLTIVLQWFIRIIVLIAVLARFGVQTTSIVAMLGAMGLAVGLALQGTLQNVASGIMLLILRPISAGEFVSVVGQGDGTVDEVGLFLTRFIQVDGIEFTLPNSSIWGSAIINYSRNKTRRMDVEVAVRYGDDLDKAIRILKKMAEGNEHVLKDPAPQVMVTQYKDSAVVVTVRVWSLSENFWNLRFELLRQAPILLKDEGLRIPVPVREISAPTDTEKASA
ncbi:mechanosensitive ion channel family protein [Paenalcaligenes suwonensis]|uniref:mechanosensitive ion channel family protein n=1 Tax=Paenalcaligenes suwonensis TaxID=1202713 RepID=UPI00140AD594|nr:mechanosensitive ion channel family protein [Paenalcaligenes suwonensis]NHC62122.1 mechanosensitive ion channel family protein [Paenalcaligenes suwonensis]